MKLRLLQNALLTAALLASSGARAGTLVAELAESCPIDSKPLPFSSESPVATIAELFLGAAVDSIVEAAAGALKEAAERDLKGVTEEAPIQPVGLYPVSKNGDRTQIGMRNCLTVAHVPATVPKDHASCEDELLKYAELSAKTSAQAVCRWIERRTEPGLAPNFYAEIRIDPRPGRQLANVQPSTVIYHAPIDPDRRGEQRSLNLTLQLREPSPEGKGGKLVGTYIGSMTSVTPAISRSWPRGETKHDAKFDAARLRQTTGWLLIPAPPEKPSGTGDAAPLDVNVSLNETGATNPFLQFFASAFEKNKAEIEKQLKSAVLPSEQAKAALDGAKAKNTLDVSVQEAEQTAETAWLTWQAALVQPVAADREGFRTKMEKTATERAKENAFRVAAAKASNARLDAHLPTRDYAEYFRSIYGS